VIDGGQQVSADALERTAATDRSRQQRLKHDEEEFARHGTTVYTRLADERDVQLTTAHQLDRSLVIEVKQTVDKRVRRPVNQHVKLVVVIVVVNVCTCTTDLSTDINITRSSVAVIATTTTNLIIFLTDR